MTSIARFVMQGPRQAALLAVLFAALPLLYWVSAAVVSLVILHRGISQGLNVLLLALLPGIAWYAAQQELTVFMVIGGCGLMAAVLRVTISLPKAVMVSLVPGVLTSLLLPSLSPKWYELLQQGSAEYLRLLVEKTPEAASFEPWILPMLLGGIAALLQLFAIGALLMARNWQSKLYNPGGFTEEFHTLRLPYWYVLVGGVFFLIGVSDPAWVGFVPVLMVPLFIMGVSLVHALVKQRQLSGQWLMAFYISFLFFLPYMYALLILVALLDIIFNFRKGFAQSQDGQD